MIIHAACIGMMCETYPDVLIPRFCQPTPKFAELRSFIELQTFTGHTPPVYGRPFFLDSGAFSAYSLKKILTVQEYGTFVKKHEQHIGPVYANLDAIPEKPTPEARAVAAARTLENQKYLEGIGLKPLPVYHMGEPWEYLERYIEEYDYICIGGMVDTGALWSFLDQCWGHYLTDSQGKPKLKVHGFGMTSLYGMARYPWYSVDSSTWLVHSKYGIIAFPRKLADGEWDWNLRPTLLGISDNSGMRKEEGKHYDNMSVDQQAEVHEYLQLTGVPLSELRGHPALRFVVNLNYWINVQNKCDFNTTFTKKQFSLL